MTTLESRYRYMYRLWDPLCSAWFVIYTKSIIIYLVIHALIMRPWPLFCTDKEAQYALITIIIAWEMNWSWEPPLYRKKTLVYVYCEFKRCFIDFSRVLQEFERTISELTSERERERVLRDIEKEQIIRERDQALHDLRSVERSFSDTQR